VPPGVVETAGRFVLLPLNYAAEFGIFLLGTVTFWMGRGRESIAGNEVARMLTVAAVTSLGLATFMRSAILANDLGWRVILFAQLAALLWTAHAIATAKLPLLRGSPGGSVARPTLAGWLLILGYLGIAYDMVALRAIRGEIFKAVQPQVTRELRTTYAWLNDHLPAGAVLQHNPLPDRVYDFGLYSRHRVGVADREAELFGAAREAVFARLRQLRPVFEGALPAAAVRAAAGANGIDYLVVSAQDPVWHQSGAWPWSTSPIHAGDHVRVIAVADLPPS
jgi:hypothetical protein